MPFAGRDGHLIHYEERGPENAPPLLLIMGLGFSSQAWSSFPDRLGRFRTIVFDNRGTGLSSKLTRLYSMRDFADDAAAVLLAAGVNSREGACVFGISMGGMIAQELTLRHPALVKSLVLGATFASWVRSAKPAMGVNLRLAGINLLGARAGNLLSKILVSEDFENQNPVFFRRWLSEAGLGQGAALLRQVSAIARHSTLKRLSHIKCPTLIITGTADKLVPPGNSRVLHDHILDSRRVELEGAGHVFPLEREEETARLLEAHFLGSPKTKTKFLEA